MYTGTFQDKINHELKLEKENVNYHQKAKDQLIAKYLNKISRDVIEQRIARMIVRGDKEATLICDATAKNSTLDRDYIVTTPLCELSPTTYKDEKRSIIDIIRNNIPDGYHVYYHYNYDDGNHGGGGMGVCVINYEITLYKSSSLLDFICVDPWCCVLCCCWECSFRFTEDFDQDVVIFY